MNSIIREILPSDEKQWLNCFITVLSLEASLEPDRRPGTSTLAGDYWKYLHYNCEKNSGKIFVAELNSEVVGFVAVWLESDDDNLITKLRRFGYVSDVAVLPAYKTKGLGRQLMEEAEKHLTSLGIKHVKVGVLAKNSGAHDFYLKLGYADHEISLLKRLK